MANDTRARRSRKRGMPPVDGIKPAKGRIETNPMSAGRKPCVRCARVNRRCRDVRSVAGSGTPCLRRTTVHDSRRTTNRVTQDRRFWHLGHLHPEISSAAAPMTGPSGPSAAMRMAPQVMRF